MGVFRRGFSQKMDASLPGGALSAKCDAGPIFLAIFCFLGRGAGCCGNPLLVKPLFSSNLSINFGFKHSMERCLDREREADK